MFPQDNTIAFRKVEVACGDLGCEGKFIHVSQMDDHSPRVDETCTSCNRRMSVKLSSIEEGRILSNTVRIR